MKSEFTMICYPLQTSLPFAVVLFTLAIAATEAAHGQQVSAADPAVAVDSLLQEHCLHCHGAETQEGDLRLDSLKADFSDRASAAVWIEVRDKLNLGEMPPEGELQPPAEQVVQVSKWIASGLREADRARISSDGRVLLRRLNRHEYTHTISDLLRMQFPEGESPLDLLPPDGTVEGFDKVSAALLVDPSLMELYYKVARRVADRAIVDGPPEFPTATMRLEFEDIAESRAIRYLVRGREIQPVPGGLRLLSGGTRSFGMLNYPGRRRQGPTPVNGFYRFTLRASASAGEDGKLPRIRVNHQHPNEKKQEIMELEVAAPWEDPQEYSVVVSRDALGGEVKVEFINGTNLMMSQRPGEHFRRRVSEAGEERDYAESFRLNGRKVAEGWGGDRSTPDPDKLDIAKYPQLFLDYLEVEGPLYEQWPPQSHVAVMGDRPVSNASTKVEIDQSLEDARQIFVDFLPRAWRRPIMDDEIEPIMNVVRTELEHGTPFNEAIRVGLATALTSPKFLFLVEPSVDATDSRPLNDYELASRLSYFLWSSMPDEELFELAAAGKLSQQSVLSAQVDRMLADPKAERFVEGFARQWLRTDSFLAFEPNKYLYKVYDENLSEAVVREPLAFFRTVLQDDLSVVNFIDSNFLVVNERLARHYGLDLNIKGDTFRRVPLPKDSHRGGLLGMAGVHQAGSDGLRTKPISRAVYVREVLFNDPPDPPPANAGEIEPNIQGEKLTVRQRLIQHQQIESCAACHRALDPYGFGLENFNVIGQWREKQDGEDFRGKNVPPIDASGRLPNGVEFTSFDEFRAALVRQSDRMRRGLAEKLIVYALGRPLEPSDDALIGSITTQMKSEGDTLRSMIKSIVLSREFSEK